MGGASQQNAVGNSLGGGGGAGGSTGQGIGNNHPLSNIVIHGEKVEL